MKKSLLQEMIREELANRVAEENEPMFNSPQAQQSQVNSWAKQVEELKALRDSLDNQIREIEELANLLNVNEGPVEDKAALDAERLAIDKKIAALNKHKQELGKRGSSLNEDNDISISGSDWEDIGLGRVITKFNDGVKISWNEDDPNLYHARVYGLNGKDENIYIDFLRKVNAKKQELGKNNQLDEETLNEMPFIGGEKGAELFNAIKVSSEKLKDQFPEATAKDISKIILSKKKRPELAPEVEDALLAQEEKYGADPNYTATLGGPQTERAVTKALGEYTPGQRGRKPMEKPATAPKATPSAPEKDEDSKASAAAEKGAESKGTSSQDKYSVLKKALDDTTAKLKAMSGSSDMEKRKALTAEKYRIESAIEKLKKVKA